MPYFYIGWHQPNNGESGPKHFERSFISVRRLWNRRSFFTVRKWILDSGAFKELELHGRYTFTLMQYANAIHYWAKCGDFQAAITPDFMCEDYIFQKRYEHTGVRYTIPDHQRLTVYNYLALRKLVKDDIYIMPVLQGFTPQDYVDCLRLYGDRLLPGMWVGVGSVCKRQGKPSAIEDVLLAIKRERPDLKLHGFGVKSTALSSGLVWELLHSADSQAHGLLGGQGSKKYVDSNNPHKALKYAESIKRNQPKTVQLRLF